MSKVECLMSNVECSRLAGRSAGIYSVNNTMLVVLMADSGEMSSKMVHKCWLNDGAGEVSGPVFIRVCNG